MRTASPARVFWTVLAGVLLLQVAYTSVVPAFRGSDEFDHAYKADSVAHGQWFGTIDTPTGRGQLIEVSPDIQRAAQSWCRAYEYTEPDDCRVVDRTADDRVLVSSAAAAYNPVYYAVVGTLARPFQGDGALWAMRATTMLASALMLAAAARVLAGTARTVWPGIGFALACTPTLLYSGSVAAPNGVGYAAALMWWCTALTLRRHRTPRLWVLFGLAAVVTVTCHSTNPLWVPVMVLALLVLDPVRHWAAVLRRDPWAVGSLLVVATATAGCLGWARLVGTHAEPEYGATTQAFPWARLVGNELVWHLQAVAAFPLRNDQAPAAVYPFWFAALALLLALGFRRAGVRTRLAMLLLAATWYVVPLVLTLLTYQTMDFAWQGRYALPLVLGLPVLAAATLDERGTPAPRRLVAGTAALTAVLHAACLVETVLQERVHGLSTQLTALVPGGPALAVLSGTVGAALLCVGATRSARPGDELRRTAPETSPMTARQPA